MTTTYDVYGNIIERPHVRFARHVANWDAVFAVATHERVAIELDGDPARQDLDDTLGEEL